MPGTAKGPYRSMEAIGCVRRKHCAPEKDYTFNEELGILTDVELWQS